MRCNLRNTVCRIVTIVVSVFVARGEVRADPEAEYVRNRYGFMAHYTYGWGGGHRYPGTCNPDGSTPKSLDEVAERFDAEGFAKDMVAFGVEYVIFTPHHAERPPALTSRPRARSGTISSTT